jgi:uncharacterized protein YkwD
MRFEISLATALLATMVAASPYMHQSPAPNGLPTPHLPEDPNQPPTYDDKDIKVTDYKYIHNGRKWWKTWTVNTTKKYGDAEEVPQAQHEVKPVEPPTYDAPVHDDKPSHPTYDSPKVIHKPAQPTYDSPPVIHEPAPSYDTPHKPDTGSQPSGGFKDEILNAHNEYRAKHGSPPLEWSEELANFARGVCNTCVMKHSGGKYGENLYAASSLTPSDAVKSWYDEISLYPYGEPSWNTAWGHFTQVVWKETTKVGCYLRTDCHGMPAGPNFLTCNYEVAGNMQGSFSKNVFPPGGGQPSGGYGAQLPSWASKPQPQPVYGY